MNEAERAFAALHLRARVVLAFAALVFVGIAQETNLAGPDIPVRALAVGVALAAAAGIEELASRRARRNVAAIAGTVAEFFALALGVALFSRYQPLAPALLLWPLVLGAAVMPRTYLLYLAAMGTAIVVEISVLRPGTALEEIIGGLAWGALYFAVAMLAASIGSRFRRFQRRTESAYASIATLTAATSYSELARILFAYAERALDLPQDAPAALLFDDRGIGTFSAIEANAIDPERRARFRIAAPRIETLRALAGASGAFVPGASAFASDGSVPEDLAAGHPFVLPLRDARRLVGFAVFAAQGRRNLTAERRTEFARVAEQVATTAVRLRGGHAIDAQREALAGVLEAHSVDRAEMQVATWLARSARDIASVHDIAVLQDVPNGGSRVMVALGLGAGDVERGCAALVSEARRRGVAVVVSDGANERRIKLPDFLRTGATALLPVGGQAIYLLVHEPEREGLSSGNLQLLVRLCDQAATLLASAQGIAPRAAMPPPAHALELRLAAVAAHTGGLARAAEAESRARIIDAFRLAIEGNQPALAGSGERVAAVAGALAGALGVDDEGRDAIYVAALLRDVGELGIDRRVLDTPGALNEDQREVVRRHPLLGETILATLSYLGDASRFVRAHHERWDGSGYPDRLAETDIPIGGRILAVADAFIAMTSERPYRAALRPAEAMAAIIGGAGAAFDPDVVDAFVALNAAGKVELHADPVRIA